MYFVYNVARLRFPEEEAPTGGDLETTLAIAAAFHDIALWTENTIDYLEPSAASAVSDSHQEH